jgi:outer membrane protein assembly factor BamA
VSTKVDTCARIGEKSSYSGNARERLMKIVRVCLVLLALWPACSFAVDSDPPDNPYVEGVQCNGNISSSCELIRSQAGITVGKPLDEIQVDNARLRLETLPNFRTVQIHLVKGSHKHWVIVVIDVTEANPITSAFALGTLAQIASQGAAVETLAARVTDHDLFGSGKSLDLSVVLALPFEGGGGQEYAARLQYSDPTLFDSRKFFFTAGVFYTQASLRFTSPSGLLLGTGDYSNSGAGVDFSVGMRLDTYSYVTVGYRYLQNTARNDEYLVSDGVIQTFNSSPGNVLLFTVGRNSEDDPSFPTHGWLLHAYDGWGPSLDNYAGLVVRGTWRAGEDAYWTFQARPFDDFRSLFDDDLGVSIVYSHNLFPSSEPGTLRRARWYVGPGVTNLGSTFGIHDYEVGLKAGIRFETRYLGTVNLYLVATHLLTGSGN